MSSKPKLAYTIAEATQASGLARTRIYEYLKLNMLHARKAGRRNIILASDLETLLAELPKRDAA